NFYLPWRARRDSIALMGDGVMICHRVLYQFHVLFSLGSCWSLCYINRNGTRNTYDRIGEPLPHLPALGRVRRSGYGTCLSSAHAAIAGTTPEGGALGLGLPAAGVRSAGSAGPGHER